MLRSSRHPASGALIGVGAIQGVVGVLGWTLYGLNFGALDWIITFSFSAYIVLGIVARWLPIPASLVATVLYSAFLGFQAYRNPDLITAGLVFKVPIVVLLLVAVVFSFGQRSPAEEP